MIDDRTRRRSRRIALAQHDKDSGKLDEGERAVFDDRASHHLGPEFCLSLEVFHHQMNVPQPHAQVVGRLRQLPKRGDAIENETQKSG